MTEPSSESSEQIYNYNYIYTVSETTVNITEPPSESIEQICGWLAGSSEHPNCLVWCSSPGISVCPCAVRKEVSKRQKTYPMAEYFQGSGKSQWWWFHVWRSWWHVMRDAKPCGHPCQYTRPKQYLSVGPCMSSFHFHFHFQFTLFLRPVKRGNKGY